MMLDDPGSRRLAKTIRPMPIEGRLARCEPSRLGRCDVRAGACLWITCCAIFLVIAGAIAVAMVGGSFVLARQRPDSEKLSPYECGFEPFEDARIRFDVRYYLVAILFIIFDLEVAFLFPWAVSLGDIGMFGFWSMVVFLGVLTIGFIYEWRKGALEWE